MRWETAAVATAFCTSVGRRRWLLQRRPGPRRHWERLVPVPPDLVLASYDTVWPAATRTPVDGPTWRLRQRSASGSPAPSTSPRPPGSSPAFSWLDALGLLGRSRDAEALLPEIIDLFDSPAIGDCLGQARGVVLVRQGRLDEARPLIDQTRAMLAESDWPSDRAWNVGAVAQFDAADGRPGHALELVDEQFARSDADATASEASLLSIGIAILADVELARVRPDVDALARAERTSSRWIDHVLAAGRKDVIQEAADAVDWEQALAHLGRLRRASEPQRCAAVADGWHELGFRYDRSSADGCALTTLRTDTV